MRTFMTSFAVVLAMGSIAAGQSARTTPTRKDAAIKTEKDLARAFAYRVIHVTAESVTTVRDGATFRFFLAAVGPFVGDDVAEQESGTAALKTMVSGKSIAFEQEPGALKNYGYVYVLPRCEMANLELVKAGKYRANVKPNFLYPAAFTGAEAEAREAGRGLWPVAERLAQAARDNKAGRVAEAKAKQDDADRLNDEALNRLVPEPGYIPGAGDEVHLYTEDGGHVPIASNYFNYEDMIKFGLASDKEGITKLRAEHRVDMLPSGTAIRIIETKDFTKIPAAEVRILSGEREGQVVWVMKSFIARLVPAYKARR